MTRVVPATALAAAVLTVAACSTEAGQAPRSHTVEIRGFEYHPASLQILAGDTVVWVNRDAVPHTATEQEGGWDSGSVAAGDSWWWVAGVANDVGYYCAFHPTMRGRITVESRSR